MGHIYSPYDKVYITRSTIWYESYYIIYDYGRDEGNFLGNRRRFWILFKHSCLSKIHGTVEWPIFGYTMVQESLFLVLGRSPHARLLRARWPFNVSFQVALLTFSKWFSKWFKYFYKFSTYQIAVFENHPHLSFYPVQIRCHCSKPISGSELRLKISAILQPIRNLSFSS